MQQYSDVVLVINVPGGQARVPAVASVQVNINGGGAATLYSDNGVTARANPIVTDSSGEYSFYAADGLYDLVISVSGFTTETKTAAVRLFDPSASSGSASIGFIQAGTGATARTGQAKMREAFSVKDFGALGDGVTNDRTAVNNARVAASGRSILFPSGTYSMGSALAFAETDRLYMEQGSSFTGTQPTWGLRDYELARGTAIVGSKMKVERLFESTPNALLLEDIGGIWPSGATQTFFGISREFTSSDGAANAPCSALFVQANNNNSPADVVGVQAVAWARTTNDVVFVANFIAMSSAGISTPKLVGIEIDLQPAAGVTPSTQSAGLLLNAFTSAIPGPAIQLGGVSGGTFNNGIKVDGLLSTISAGLSPVDNASMGSLVNTGIATYADAAIVFVNNHKLQFKGTAAAHALIYNDTGNFLHIVTSTAGIAFRNNTDTSTTVFLDTNGTLDIQGGGAFKHGSVQVVGARRTGWSATTGTEIRTNFGDASLSDTSQALRALVVDLKTHGLIGA